MGEPAKDFGRGGALGLCTHVVSSGAARKMDEGGMTKERNKGNIYVLLIAASTILL